MDWEGAKPTRSRRGAIAAGLAAALVIGFLVRVPDTTGPGGLDVVTADPTTTPSPTPTRTPAPRASPRARPTPSPTPEPSIRDEVGSWHETAPSPVRVAAPMAAAWTGREVLAVGGDLWTTRRVTTAAGAAYDPEHDRWRRLPDAPLTPRSEASSVWTGRVLFVWGGNDDVGHRDDGALYDPAQDRWTPIARGPLSPRSGAHAVWTGSEILVVGGGDNAGALTDAVAYDPATDEWRGMPRLPLVEEDIYYQAVGVDGGVLLWRPDAPMDDMEADGVGPTTAVWLDVAARRWRTLDPPERFAEDPLIGAAWTGRRLLLVQQAHPGVRVLAASLGSGRWRELSAAGQVSQDWFGAAQWTGDSLLVQTDTTLLRFHPGTGRWSRIPGAMNHRLVGAGDRLVIWTEISDYANASGDNVRVRRLRPPQR